jgi:hypothetical protein
VIRRPVPSALLSTLPAHAQHRPDIEPRLASAAVDAAPTALDSARALPATLTAPLRPAAAPSAAQHRPSLSAAHRSTSPASRSLPPRGLTLLPAVAPRACPPPSAPAPNTPLASRVAAASARPPRRALGPPSTSPFQIASQISCPCPQQRAHPHACSAAIAILRGWALPIAPI